MYLPPLLMFWVCLLLRIFFFTTSVCVTFFVHPWRSRVARYPDVWIPNWFQGLWHFVGIASWRWGLGKRIGAGGFFLAEKKTWTLMKVDQFMWKFHFNHVVSIVHEFICGWIKLSIKESFFFGLLQLYDFPFWRFGAPSPSWPSRPRCSASAVCPRAASKDAWWDPGKVDVQCPKSEELTLTLPSDFWGFWGSLQRSAFRRKIHENFPGSVHCGTPNLTR